MTLILNSFRLIENLGTRNTFFFLIRQQLLFIFCKKMPQAKLLKISITAHTTPVCKVDHLKAICCMWVELEDNIYKYEQLD